MSKIEAIRMPKWGLAMEEGKIVEWWVKEGDTLSEGDDLVDIETSKITNVCEANAGGTLRRIVAGPDETLPVGALIAVMADPDVPEAEIDAFIEDDQARFDPGEAAAEAAGPEIGTVEAAGRALRVAVMGAGADGVPLVLLHGFGGDLNTWMLVQEPLGADRPVHALELPGHGQSSKDVGEGTLADLSDIVIAAIDALELDRFALAGHSLGGAIAVEVAARLGERVTALGLVCPAALPGTQINAEYLDAFVAARRTRDLREPAKLLFADPGLVTRDMLEDLIRAKRLDGAEAALGAIANALTGGDPAYGRLGDRLGELGIPLRVLASKADTIVGAPNASDLPARTELIWIEGVGHMPHLEKPSEVVAALRGL